jgi:uncharacterized protein (DUF433 family)
MKTLFDRITIDPELCHGKPCIRGLRYPVEMILELLSGDMSTEEILDDYEDLNQDDIKACLLFASKLSQVKMDLHGSASTQHGKDELPPTKPIQIDDRASGLASPL